MNSNHCCLKKILHKGLLASLNKEERRQRDHAKNDYNKFPHTYLYILYCPGTCQTGDSYRFLCN